jgi:hypothetical protein
LSEEVDLVTVIISDPWEFPDENGGRIGFVARIVGTANGHWLLRFLRPVVFEGRLWNFAIPATRFDGQPYFDQPGDANALTRKPSAASILFVTDEQAQTEPFLASFDSRALPNTPWVLGSVERGVSSAIPKGADSVVISARTRPDHL